jgi:hypothetical protein
MDAHFKQISDILKEKKCQGQLVANRDEYYMEDECTYYHKQVVTLRSEEMVENRVDERKEEQTEVPQEPHHVKQESIETSSTLALILETPRGQERNMLELPNEQIEDIKIESSLSFLLILFQFMSPHQIKNCLRKLIIVHPDIETIGILLQ